jgi:uncharacterized protein (DUF305 family)
MISHFKTITFAGAALLALAQLTMPTGAYAQTPAKMPAAQMQGGIDMKAMMKDNGDKMSSMEMTGKPDVDFAMMMRMHHQGALQMAETELMDGKDPHMKRMAKSIIATQKKEIAEFDRFLAAHEPKMEKKSK